MAIGKVIHFYDKIDVAVVELEEDLNVGDKIHFLGHGIDFVQEVESMQIEHGPVEHAKKGQSIGLKTKEPVKTSCIVELAE